MEEIAAVAGPRPNDHAQTSPCDKGMTLNLEATPIALPQPPGLRRRAEPDGHVACFVVVIRVPTPRACCHTLVLASEIW
jgi:hypothetical protein